MGTSSANACTMKGRSHQEIDKRIGRVSGCGITSPWMASRSWRVSGIRTDQSPARPASLDRADLFAAAVNANSDTGTGTDLFEKKAMAVRCDRETFELTFSQTTLCVDSTDQVLKRICGGRVPIGVFVRVDSTRVHTSRASTVHSTFLPSPFAFHPFHELGPSTPQAP
jgi:hypothetical protein